MGVASKLFHVVNRLKRPNLVPVIREAVPNSAFADKVALVTGGDGGIGSEIAKQLVAGGCDVTISGRNEDKLAAVAESIGARFVRMDYADTEEVESRIHDMAVKHGGIDLFVSCVGIHTEDVDFWALTSDEFDRVINVNLRGTFFATRAAALEMKEGGHVLLIGSSRGFEPAWSPYGISKWGIRGMTLGLAKQLAPRGISVNSIAPGATATMLIGYEDGDNISAPENSFGRYVMPSEVAGLALYFLSDAANMVSGETIRISGGRGSFNIR